MNKIIKRRMLPLVVGLGAVVIAACGGSSTSTPEAPTTLFQKNASLISNVKHYSGLSSISNVGDVLKEFPSGSFVAGDRVAFDFDLNLDAVDADPAKTASTSSYSPLTGIDFRSAFSNFSLKGLDGNVGSVDLSKIVWAKCPLKVVFSPPRMMYGMPGSTSGSSGVGIGTFFVTFAEAPNASLATDKCHPLPPSISSYTRYSSVMYGTEKMNFYDAESKPVEATGVKFTLAFESYQTVIAKAPLSSEPLLKEICPSGLDQLVSLNSMPSSSSVHRQVALTPGYARQLLVKPSLQQPVRYILRSVTSAKIKDYAPFDLTATATVGGIDAEWKRSVDLSVEDVATSVIETSKDNFENILTSAQVPSADAIEKLSLASCEVDPKNKLKAGTTISVRVKALDKNGVASAYSDVVSVEKAADNIACPEATLAAPSDLKAEFGVASKEYSLSWQKPVDAEDTEITYCVEWSSDAFVTQDVADRSCVGADTTSVIAWGGQATRSFRVVASSENGVVSLPSEVVEVAVPRTDVTAPELSFVDDGVEVSWGISQVEGSTGQYGVLRWGEMKDNARGPETGSATVSGSNYIISRVDLNESFSPGVEVWVDVFGCTDVSCSKPKSATILLPKAAVPIPEVEMPEVEAPVETTVAVSPDTSVAPEASTSTTLVVAAAPVTVPQLPPAPGCYIMGAVRGCGPYVLRG